MSRRDANAAFAGTSLTTAAMPTTSTPCTPATRPIPGSGRQVALEPGESLEGRPKGRRPERPGRLLAAQTIWQALPRGDLVAALDGDWDETGKAVGEKLQAKAQTKGVELTAGHVQQATRN